MALGRTSVKSWDDGSGVDDGNGDGSPDDNDNGDY